MVAAMNAGKGNLETGHYATYKAGGAIPANSLVKYDSTEGQVVVTTAITDVAIGVSMGTYAIGDQAQIQTSGVATVLSGAAGIALGAQVMPDATQNGGIATAAGATAVSVGIAEQAAAGGGDVVRVRLCTPNLKAPANA